MENSEIKKVIYKNSVSLPISSLFWELHKVEKRNTLKCNKEENLVQYFRLNPFYKPISKLIDFAKIQ